MADGSLTFETAIDESRFLIKGLDKLGKRTSQGIGQCHADEAVEAAEEAWRKRQRKQRRGRLKPQKKRRGLRKKASKGCWKSAEKRERCRGDG